MVNNNPLSPEQPDDKVNNIISELKQFLSGIKQEVPASTTTPANIAVPERPVDVFLNKNNLTTPPSNPLIPPIFSEPTNGNGFKMNGSSSQISGEETAKLPSDSEFWNGNVLGWDPSSEAPLKSEPTMPFFKEEDPGEILPLPEKNGFSFADMQAYMAERPEEKPAAPEPSYEAPMPSFFGHPQADPFMPLESVPLAPPPVASPPLSPEQVQLPEPAMQEYPPRIESPFMQEPSSPLINTPPPVEEIPAPPVNGIVIDQHSNGNGAGVHLDLHAPLPENIDSRVSENGLIAEEFGVGKLEMKPDNIIHAACIIPSSNKADGQFFFKKMKEVASKSKNKLDIEAVFIHEWAANSIDMEAWEKSAILSGADTMFIVASRKDQPQFIPFINKSKNSILKKHMVVLEHVKLQNLYAELVYQISRKA